MVHDRRSAATGNHAPRGRRRPASIAAILGGCTWVCGRIVGVHAGAEEVVAAPGHRRDGGGGLAADLRAGLRAGTVHLHHLLRVTGPPSSARSVPRQGDSCACGRRAREKAVMEGNRKINLLLLTTTLGIGGAEIVVRDLARSLDRKRFNVSICCLKAQGPIQRELAADGIDISALPNTKPDRANYFTSIELRRLIRRKRIDLVHTHTTYALVDAALSKAHDTRAEGRPYLSLRQLSARGKPNSVDGTNLCEAGRSADRRRGGAATAGQSVTPTRRVGNWPGAKRSATAIGGNRRLQTFRSRIGAEGKILVGTVATMIPQKGLQNLLHVARRVRDARQDVMFVVVGDGVLRPELERLRHALDLDGTVVFPWLADKCGVARRTLLRRLFSAIALGSHVHFGPRSHGPPANR